ncbi:hypothetical protein Aduo_000003 [Ancylostoma duodenale]
MKDPHGRNESQQPNFGPIENLLRESTTATHRAVNAIRSAETAKAKLRNDINSLTTSFDKAIQKSLALIDRLDESVYSGRIDNAKKRAKVEKEARALIDKAHCNPAENADLRLFERTVDVLRDSAIGLHREYFAYDETVDADDILAQLNDILNQVSGLLLTFQDNVRNKEHVANIEKRVGEMRMKMAQGDYGQKALCTGNPACNTTPGNRMYLMLFRNILHFF